MSPTSADPEGIRKHIRNYYQRLFDGMQSCRVPILKGKTLAASLGYPMGSLDGVSERYWDRFVPCGNPLPHLDLSPGDTILNLGCGVGMDSLAIACECQGRLTIVGVDVVPGVLRHARELTCGHPRAQRAGDKFLCWVCGDGERLPLRTARFDWVILNGVFNLFPDKRALLKEIGRALKPCGGLVGADLCRVEPLPAYFEKEWDAWAWCISGACTEEELTSLLQESAFTRIELTREEEKDMLYRVEFSCRRVEQDDP